MAPLRQVGTQKDSEPEQGSTWICCSVTKSCQTLGNTMNCGTPGLRVSELIKGHHGQKTTFQGW